MSKLYQNKSSLIDAIRQIQLDIYSYTGELDKLINSINTYELTKGSWDMNSSFSKPVNVSRQTTKSTSDSNPSTANIPTGDSN